jgi:asparagine synthase (glutamine-hydrolysing)
LGLLAGDGYLEDGEGRLSLLSGDPLVPEIADLDTAEVPRERALKQLHQEWLLGQDDSLLTARGDFCGLHFDHSTQRIRLCVDRLGLRPLYCAEIHGCLVFATSLRMMLLLMPSLGSQPDLCGQLQVVTFGYTLGERTPFENVRLLRPAHVLEVNNGSIQTRRYFDWHTCPTPNVDNKAPLERLQQVFADGVRLRLQAQAAVIAQLSGGLDSRCVVAGLRHQRAKVHSINFSPPGSADLVLGRLASQTLGTHHLEVSDGPASVQGRSAHAHRRLMEQLGDASDVTQPRAIWSGLGGESVLSQPEMSPDLVSALEAGDARGAVALYLPLLGVAFPARMFRPKLRARLECFLSDGLLRELGTSEQGRLVRSFNVFRMTEHLRGPLRRRFETMDIDRLEYIKPFCDPELVSCALDLALRDTVHHRLYYRWLDTFELPISRVPWQAYPGSDPCPIPLPDGLRNQWEGGWFSSEELAEQKRQERARFASQLRSPHFPAHTLSRKNLWTALALGGLGVHRFWYLLSGAMPIIEFSVMGAKAKAGTLE